MDQQELAGRYEAELVDALLSAVFKIQKDATLLRETAQRIEVSCDACEAVIDGGLSLHGMLKIIDDRPERYQ